VTSRLLAPACLLTLAASLHAADAPLPKAPDGFKVELVLQAPDIEAPTALCVAPNGDVYFAEDPMDMGGPPTKNLDRIWLLKGGDPTKKVLFAENMWAVMGLELVGDKLYVVHAPYVTVFTLDAEGKAKERTDLFTDLGPPVAGVPSFNDHIPSGVRCGADGWLYVSVGDKGIPKMTRKEKDGGSCDVAEGRWRYSKEGNHISLEGGGVIRFRPDGSGLEVFASGTRNHLDVPMDEHDRIFVRDNTDDGRGWNTRFMYLPPGGFMGYPWAYTRRPAETLPMIHDFGGGAPCGGWVYLDDGLPETYRGRIFHCEWGQGKVWAVKVEPDGAGFKYVDQIAFLDPEGTGVKDFRPFTIRPTADGRGFYVTDWGFSGWLQNKKAGRIYKVTYVKDDVKPAPRGKDTDSVEDLIKALDHPAYTERLRAQRALRARGKDAAEAVAKKVQKGELSKRALQRAIWVIDESPCDDCEDAALNATKDSNAEVRLEAVRAISEHPPVFHINKGSAVAWGAKEIERLSDLMKNDPDAQVRMQAAVALREVDAQPRLLVLESERDPFVRYEIVKSLLRTNWELVLGILKEKNSLKGRPRAASGLILALTDAYDTGAVNLLAFLAKSDDAETRGQAVAALASVYKDRKPYPGTWWGTQPAARTPPARDVEWKGTPAVRDAVLAALADKDDGVRKAAVAGLLAMNDPATLDPLTKQFTAEKDLETRTDIVRAVAGVQAPKAAEFLAGLLKDSGNPEALRLEALAGLEKVKTSAAAESIAAAAEPKEPVALQVRALEALGALKAPAGKAAATAGLKSAEPAVRRAAAGALGQFGDPASVELLTPLLDDKEAAVRVAVVQGLGALKAKAAVPALIKATADEATQFDAVAALAQTPDPRALSAYLTGLGSKNADLRAACKAAIPSIRDEAAPALEQLVKGNEVRPELLPELRSIYSNFAPVLDWKLIGPFPADGKAYPPETELKFDAAYEGADKKQVKWRDQKGDAKRYGKVNLAALFSPNNDVVAYGYAEVESATARPAQLLVGSDDTIVIWLNGKKVFEFGGNRGWVYNQDKVDVQLEKGKNALLIKCGNASGPWEYSVAVSGDAEKYAFLQGGGKKFNLEEFRDFARKNKGDAERGAKLFRDVKGLACIKCHAVAGEGGNVGPDLAGIGLKYKREDLMTSVLEPSKVIAQGYETVVVTTVKGVVYKGVFKGETADALSLADPEGKLITISKKEIDERKFSPVSTMPNGLNDGMTLQDFADVVAYLEARREEKPPQKK
jgi:putative membrane-bound dehydrogenase-like protein